MPKLSRVLETALYARPRKGRGLLLRQRYGFFRASMPISVRAYDVGGNGVLLLFPQGGSLQSIETPGG
jgi:hypothetical protein